MTDSESICSSGAEAPAVGDAAAKKLEKMAMHDAERRAEAERRKEEAREHQDPRESVKAFLSAQQAKQQSWQAEVGSVSSAGLGADEAKQKLEALAGALQEMEAAVAEASYFLPAYDQRSLATCHREMQQQLSDARGKLLPKKKFSFGSGRIARKKGAEVAAAAPPAQARPAPGADKAAGAPAPPPPVAPAPGRGLTGLRGVTAVVSAEALGGSDYTLMDLRDCDVFLLGRTSALRCHGLERCRVHCGPVAGSAFLDAVSSCVLHLPAHQVRIHTATATDFYLRVRSNPIIEHSSGLRFAPTAFQCPGGAAKEILQAAGLGEGDPSTDGKWKQVDDFGWLRAVHSPNWCVLPEEERREAIAPPPAGEFDEFGVFTAPREDK